MYTYSPNPEGQLYFVPKEKLPKDNYRINYGYVLKEDSVKQCYDYYYESLEIFPSEPKKKMSEINPATDEGQLFNR